MWLTKYVPILKTSKKAKKEISQDHLPLAGFLYCHCKYYVVVFQCGNQHMAQVVINLMKFYTNKTLHKRVGFNSDIVHRKKNPSVSLSTYLLGLTFLSWSSLEENIANDKEKHPTNKIILTAALQSAILISCDKVVMWLSSTVGSLRAQFRRISGRRFSTEATTGNTSGLCPLARPWTYARDICRSGTFFVSL